MSCKKHWKLTPCWDCGCPVYGHRCHPCAANYLVARPSTVLTLQPEAAAWVGAMVEGEGTIRWRSHTPRPLPDVSICNTEVETISTILRLVGAGHVYAQKQKLGRKRVWRWVMLRRADVARFLQQISPYLTGKRETALQMLVELAPMGGASCHPVHLEGAADTVHNTPEQIEKNWAEFRKSDKVDPRAIRRQHRWKPAHEPDYPEPDSGWITANVKFEGPPGDPDQRDLLAGGPESGLPCERCGEMTRIVGRMSVWEILHQSTTSGDQLVGLVNEKEVTKERKRELQNEFIAVLKCPTCFQTWQWREELLPRTAHRA